MLTIDNSCLATMNSPAKYLLELLPQAVADAVAERKDEFWGHHANGSLEIIDSPDFILDVEPDVKRIRISSRVAEIAWCAAYAYTSIWRQLLNSDSLGNEETITLSEETTEGIASSLYAWALNQWLKSDSHIESDWPSGSPCPLPNSETPNSEMDITGKALMVIAFLLQHEFAHIRLGHVGPSNVEDEKEADASAVDWFLEKCPSDAKRDQRGYAIATAMSIIVARDIHRCRLTNGTTHPRSFDRLSHSLERYFAPDEEYLWSYVSTILSVHISNSNLRESRPPDEPDGLVTAYDAVQIDLDYLANSLDA